MGNFPWPDSSEEVKVLVDMWSEDYSDFFTFLVTDTFLVAAAVTAWTCPAFVLASKVQCKSKPSLMLVLHFLSLDYSNQTIMLNILG